MGDVSDELEATRQLKAAVLPLSRYQGRRGVARCLTVLLEKRDGRWQIASLHLTRTLLRFS